MTTTPRLTRDDVAHVADLARLTLTDDELDAFTGQLADVLDHATTEIAVGTKLGIDATKKLPAEGYRRTWPPLIKMDESTKLKIDDYLNKRK